MSVRDLQIPRTFIVLLQSILQANDEEMMSLVNLTVVERMLIPK